MVGFYNYTVVLTYLGVCSGIAGIGFALGGNTVVAVICLMFSGCCDMFDGRVARSRERTDPERKFGIQIDSLADLICFGTLPAAIGYSLGLTSWYGTVALTTYVLAALIRLVYYNVTEDALEVSGSSRTHYDGLPVTASALLIPLLYTFRPLLNGSFQFAYMAWLMLLAAAFLVKVKVPKPGLRGIACAALAGAAILACLIIGWNRY